MVEKVSNEEKEEILDRVERRAAAYQYEFKGCGQTILLPLQQEFDLPGGSVALKAATFFGLGTARMGNMCGALFGGIMAIGLASGRENFEDPMYPEPQVLDETTGMPRSLELVRRFYQRFVEEFGSWLCRDLQKIMVGQSYDMGKPGESEKFMKAGGNEKCAELVGKTARFAAETILEMPRR